MDNELNDAVAFAATVTIRELKRDLEAVFERTLAQLQVEAPARCDTEAIEVLIRAHLRRSLQVLAEPRKEPLTALNVFALMRARNTVDALEALLADIDKLRSGDARLDGQGRVVFLP